MISKLRHNEGAEFRVLIFHRASDAAVYVPPGIVDMSLVYVSFSKVCNQGEPQLSNMRKITK